MSIFRILQHVSVLLIVKCVLFYKGCLLWFILYSFLSICRAGIPFVCSFANESTSNYIIFSLSQLTNDVVKSLYAFIFFVDSLFYSFLIFHKFLFVLNLNLLQLLFIKCLNLIKLLSVELFFLRLSSQRPWRLRLIVLSLS